jgi:hypothetical protein
VQHGMTMRPADVRYSACERVGSNETRSDRPFARGQDRLSWRRVGGADRRLGARLFGAVRTVGNPDHGGADSARPYVYASPALGVNFRFCRCPAV